MKKLFAVLLAVAMLCTMSISAFAAGIESSNITGEVSTDLKVMYKTGTNEDAYAVTIRWDSMVFTYTSGGQRWNTEKMIWEDNTGSWSEAQKVTITNKSSLPIKAKFECVLEANPNGVDKIDITPINPTLTAGDGGFYTIQEATPGTATENGTATEEVFNIRPSGTYTGTKTEAVKVATITIALG